jgi:CheY-like chemotaxis protein
MPICPGRSKTPMHAVRDATDAEPRDLARENDRLRKDAQGVFHEFNNQLTIISGYANLLIEDDAVEADTRSKLGEIARAADRAKEIARKLVAGEAIAPAHALRVGGGTERVLVVDDEPGVRLFMRTVLEQLQYDVTDAATPGEAVQRVKDGLRPDLVVTDVVMPGMNGRRLIAELQALVPGFKVLYVSGFVDPSVTLEFEAIDFLAKPFSGDMLARRVRSLLDAEVPS